MLGSIANEVPYDLHPSHLIILLINLFFLFWNLLLGVSLLKGMIAAFTTSCSKMIGQWQNRAGLEGTREVDIWPELQKLTADAISRAAFGSSYEEGKRIFELQTQLIMLTLEAMQTLYIPGFRYVSSI